MIHAQNTKAVVAIEPAVVKATTATPITIDTKGFDYITVYVLLGATDADLTTLKVTESDKADSGFADIPLGKFEALPKIADAGKAYAFYISLLGRERYLRVTATVGAGSIGANLTALAQLSRARTSTDTAAARGLGGQVVVI